MLFIALALLLDITTTTIGLSLGLQEAGPLASRILPLLGPRAHAALETSTILLLYTTLRRIPWTREWAEAIAVLGPWTAAWHNTGLILRVLHGA